MQTNPLHMFPDIEVVLFLMAHAYKIQYLIGGDAQGVTGSALGFAVKTIWDATRGAFATPEIRAQIRAEVCMFNYVIFHMNQNPFNYA